ncbi:MAG: NTP transferase domain-containing protein, partial [Alphaproteobacteria bacterium]|nr:NTP transferase domain-containing protein [Alphaproteobacteria bacterium]
MVRALILAGGLGKRLRPVTDYLPKPLVPVLNVPILGWQLRHLGRHGIRDVTVCAGYKASLLADYARRAGRGMRVDISEEKSPLGTAGAAKRAARGRRGPFIIMNGDVITDIDL